MGGSGRGEGREGQASKGLQCKQEEESFLSRAGGGNYIFDLFSDSCFYYLFLATHTHTPSYFYLRALPCPFPLGGTCRGGGGCSTSLPSLCLKGYSQRISSERCCTQFCCFPSRVWVVFLPSCSCSCFSSSAWIRFLFSPSLQSVYQCAVNQSVGFSFIFWLPAPTLSTEPARAREGGGEGVGGGDVKVT